MKLGVFEEKNFISIKMDLYCFILKGILFKLNLFYISLKFFKIVIIIVNIKIILEFIVIFFFFKINELYYDICIGLFY